MCGCLCNMGGMEKRCKWCSGRGCEDCDGTGREKRCPVCERWRGMFNWRQGAEMCADCQNEKGDDDGKLYRI